MQLDVRLAVRVDVVGQYGDLRALSHTPHEEEARHEQPDLDGDCEVEHHGKEEGDQQDATSDFGLLSSSLNVRQPLML